MKHQQEDTIAAIATPLGEGGVGVVRVSGEGSKEALSRLFISSNGSEIASHKMLTGWLINPTSKIKIDQIMACYMRGPKSYTGEDVVELYCHGGPAVVQQVLNIALSSGVRLATKGEFTKRAFLNGKLDLSQAEAVLDLVKARTAQGAGYAVNQLEGKLSKAVHGIRTRAMGILATLEAQIDFPEDVPELNHKAIMSQLSSLRGDITNLLDSARAGRVFRQGVAAVIAGKPNVGKSCLLNALLGEDRAIVTDLPGTTRDAIEETIDVNGLPLRVIDTAGIRRPRDKAEELGVERAENELVAADFALIVVDASRPLDKQDKKIAEMANKVPRAMVLNKVDLRKIVKRAEVRKLAGRTPIFEVSALYGQGINELKKGIYAIIMEGLGQSSRNPIVVNTRHSECLRRADEALSKAALSSKQKMSADFISIDIKDAVLALGEVSGELVSEEVINAIFEQFCVGK